MELSNYEASLKAYRDNKNTLDYAFEKGREEGFKEGLQQGIERRIEKGIKQGIEQTKLEVVKNLHAIPMPVEQIAKAVNLSKEDVEKLLNQQ